MGLGRFVTAAAIVAMVGMSGAPFLQAGTIVREKGRTFIVDQRGERWEVTQAQSLGFVPERFPGPEGRRANPRVNPRDRREEWFLSKSLFCPDPVEPRGRQQQPRRETSGRGVLTVGRPSGCVQPPDR
jgi:hypothetical protein